MYCTKCGAPMDDNAKFCTECGTPNAEAVEAAVETQGETIKETVDVQETVEPVVESEPAQETFYSQEAETTPPPQAEYSSAAGQTQEAAYSAPVKPVVNTTPMLIWSIVNLVMCCLPLGIVGLVFTLNAGNAATQTEADEKLSKAKLFNIIGTIAGPVIGILWFVFAVIMGSSSY